MTAAWDDPGASLDRTVDAHIKMLRAKLREGDKRFQASFEDLVKKRLPADEAPR